MRERTIVAIISVAVRDVESYLSLSARGNALDRVIREIENQTFPKLRYEKLLRTCLFLFLLPI